MVYEVQSQPSYKKGHPVVGNTTGLPDSRCRLRIRLGCLRDVTLCRQRTTYRHDISSSMVAKANSSYGEPDRVTFLQAEAEQIPLEDNSFDLVVSFESVFFWPDISKALMEIHRVLVPGGCLAIFTGLYEGMKFQRFMMRISQFFVGDLPIFLRRAQEYKGFFGEAGFSHISQESVNCVLCISGSKAVGAPFCPSIT